MAGKFPSAYENADGKTKHAECHDRKLVRRVQHRRRDGYGKDCGRERKTVREPGGAQQAVGRKFKSYLVASFEFQAVGHPDLHDPGPALLQQPGATPSSRGTARARRGRLHGYGRKTCARRDDCCLGSVHRLLYRNRIELAMRCTVAAGTSPTAVTW